MTTYEKELIELVKLRFGNDSPAKITERLMSMGIVDYSRCKILSVREYVGGLMKKGSKKTDAMWEAAERFACSYEYIRKCMYYYKDINIC